MNTENAHNKKAISPKKENILILGSGFSSLSAACYLAAEGYKVTVYEKNETIGGRARQLKTKGFTFDMGPTFYWMPDVFEKFFADFGKKVSDYYELIRLDPGYEIYFGKADSVKISADIEQIYKTFENIEPGSSRYLRKFLRDAEFNYRTAMDKVVYKPGKTIFELITPATASRVHQFFSSLSTVVYRGVKNPKLRQILEFPVIFLGAKPSDTPAFYCFMNYADMVLGTWHIRGGMFGLVDAMKNLAVSMGVEIKTNNRVTEICTENNKVTGVKVNSDFIPADVVLSGADYHHTEFLLPEKFRNYTDKYWDSRVMAPSALLYYVGFNQKIDKVSHHTLFFDTSFDEHAELIYDRPAWPKKPLFYASFPTKTDKDLAPEGKEAGIFLIPIAPGLNDTPEIRKHYFDQIMERMEKLLQMIVRDKVDFYESYSVSDFTKDYHAFKGNAYGLSNILLQTAFLKPKLQNRKLKNMFYTGQLTVPGPGVPPTVISGKITATLINEYLSKKE